MDRRSGQTEARTAPQQETQEGPHATSASLPPLPVSGLVVSTAALVAALRADLPQLVTVEPLDGGQFLLLWTGAEPGTAA